MKSALLICTLAILSAVYANEEAAEAPVLATTEAPSYEVQHEAARNDVTQGINELIELHTERVVGLRNQLNTTLSSSLSTLQDIVNIALNDVRTAVDQANADSFNTDTCYNNASDHLTNLTSKSNEDLDKCKANAVQELDGFAEIVRATKTLGENLLVKLENFTELCQAPNEEEKRSCLLEKMQSFPSPSYMILIEVTKSFKLPIVNGTLNPTNGCIADIILHAREVALDVKVGAEDCVQARIASATS